VARALVSGHAGFVGRHIAERLVKDGWDVTGVDIRSSDFETSIQADCRDIFAVAGGYDLLVHCAAIIGSRQERDDNPLAVYEDLSLDQQAIAWCAETETPLLYFSSSAAYPTDTSGPFREADLHPNMFHCPDAAYGFIKMAGERQCRDLKRVGGKVYVARPFSGYGADQSLDYPFPAILKRAKAREDPLTVWSDVERDFIHIDDVVDACLTMVDKGIPGPVNVGSGVPTKMTELAALAATTVGYKPEIKVLGRSVGPDHRFADTTLLRTFYEPKVSLVEGVRMCVEGR
jgi:nucleoside-diphosphate-sugar epimerase